MDFKNFDEIVSYAEEHRIKIAFENTEGEGGITFPEALKAATEEIEILAEKAQKIAGDEEAKVFEAYRMLLEDDMLIAPIRQEITEGTDPCEAVTKVTEKMSEKLLAGRSEYLRERAEDIRFIGKILCDALSGGKRFTLPEGEDKIILLARELTPVDTISLDTSRLAGLATVLGGTTSHVVLLAKSLGIPAIVGIDNITAGDFAYIDGSLGELVINPDSEKSVAYEKKIADEVSAKKAADDEKCLDAVTKSGKKISVLINIGSPADIENTDISWVDGVGLFRTEFLFSHETKEPGVREQTESYRKILSAFPKNTVTVRTLDAGGDKNLSYLNIKKEDNPFLGLRGIRLCLKNREVFKRQITAILIAAKSSGVKIMFPMITSLNELKLGKEMVKSVKHELSEQNIPHCEAPLIGVMIETPAAAEISDILATESDFFSVGTNDLVQYLTASDRGNADVADVFDYFHPAVERVLKRIADNAKTASIPVSICGDLASNTEYLPKLIKMGYSSFSVPLPAAADIKKIIRTLK